MKNKIAITRQSYKITNGKKNYRYIIRIPNEIVRKFSLNKDNKIIIKIDEEAKSITLIKIDNNKK